MIQIFTAFIFLVMLNTNMIFDFNKLCDISNWNIVDDVVMGGRSAGNFELNANGSGVFKGSVSIANNGGFSSVRYRFKSKEVSAYHKFVIYVKGDGKQYQFRVKSNSNDFYSYVAYFETSKDWQIVEIPFSDLYPTFRGRKLDQSNFKGDKIEEIGFLFGNKKAEDFNLEIDKIELK